MARNPYFRPRGEVVGLEDGIGNLAQMFAPPSLADVYHGAQAQAVRQKTQTAADLYRQAQDPNFNQQAFDRGNIAAGNYNPNQSYYAQEQNTETKRRGDDLQLQGTQYSANASAGAARYGHDQSRIANMYHTDVGATTSRANNTADNSRAIQVKAMDPLNDGQTQFLPPAIAKDLGVPETRRGNITLNPGQTNIAPDGVVREGAPKPLDESQMKAQIMGTMPPEQQRAIAMGNTPIENVGGVPKTRPQVLEDGVAPIDRTHAAQLGNYRTPDGRSGNFVYDPASGQPVDAQTRLPLPQGAQLQSPTGVQNDKGMGPTTANTTEANRKDAIRAETLQAIDRYAALLQSNPGVVGIPATVRGMAQNAVSVVQEFSAAFGNTPLDAVITPDQAAALASRVGAGTRDPAIAQARVMQLDLAYKMAQNANPTGEVSRQALERQLEAITGGSLPNNASALEALKAQRDIIVGGQVGIDRLRNPQAGGAPQTPPAQAPRPRAQNPNTGETVEFDGQQWVPVK